MKLDEMARKTCDISIGYDDHVSVYSVHREELKKIYTMDNAEEINDYIVDHGEYLGLEDEGKAVGDIFFDVSNEDLGELRSQIMSFLQER